MDIDPDKNVVVVTGKNRQGKTSVLDTIWMLLGGKTNIPEQPIKEGEQNAYGFLDLGEYTVERRFEVGKERLVIKTKDGTILSKPQTMLNGMLASRAKDPLAFLRLDPKQQSKVLQQMVKMPFEKEELQAMSGIDLQYFEGDPIELIESCHKQIFEERTEVGREKRRLENVIASYEIPPEMGDAQPVELSGLLLERAKLEEVRLEKTKKEHEVAHLTDRIKKGHQLIDGNLEQIEQLEKEIAIRRQQVEDYQKAIRDLEVTRDTLADEIRNTPDPDFSTIDNQLAQASEINKWASVVEQRNKDRGELHEIKTKHSELSGKLNKIEYYRTELIEKANMPISGLGFADGIVTYNGLPLTQASGREQIEISCAICFAENPQIRVMTIDVGWSELDAEGKEVLINWAKEKGAQIWVTKVADEPESEGFHIYDGNLVAVDGVPT
jgi:recombinational DNA repair ATPase RecF